MEQTYQPFDFTNLRDLLTILFKYKKKILLVCAVVFLIAIVYALMIPREYEAKSTILVKLGREFMNHSETSGGPSGYSVRPDMIIRAEVNILMSKDILGKVVDIIGAENLYPGLKKMHGTKSTPRDIAVRLLSKNLTVNDLPNSSLINVAFTHADANMTSRVVNTLVDVFKDKHLDVFSSTNTSFLEDQRKAYENRLKNSEENLAVFKQKNRVFAFEEQRSGLITQMSTLDGSLKEAQHQISELEQKIAFIRSPKWTIDTPPELRTQLATLQQRERELLERYTENSRAVRNVRQEIQVVRESMNKGVEDLRRIELGRVEGELSVVRARASTLKNQLGQVEGEVRSLDGRERELQGLKRETVQQEQNYQTYARKLEESLIMDDMDRRKMVAISVIEKAAIPVSTKQQSLGKAQIITAGFFGGLIAGIALAFFLEFMASGMTTPYSAERRLGVPVMVAVVKKE